MESEDRSRGSLARERVLLSIGCVVTAVWAIGSLVQFAYPTHVVPWQVHLVMFSVASFFFGKAAFESYRGGGGK